MKPDRREQLSAQELEIGKRLLAERDALGPRIGSIAYNTAAISLQQWLGHHAPALIAAAEAQQSDTERTLRIVREEIENVYKEHGNPDRLVFLERRIRGDTA